MGIKIFVSGNQTELRDERRAIKDLIVNHPTLKKFFDVFIFEDSPARGRSPVSTYLDEVRNSDIYIGIIGNKYGSKGDDGLSPTEREFRTFLHSNLSKDILIFIKNEGSSDRDSEIRDWIQEIKEYYIYRRFGNIDELKLEILNSLILCLDISGMLTSEEFDVSINITATYESLDENEVKYFMEERVIDLPKRSPKEFLLNTLKVIKESDGVIKLTNTALLFFGKNPAEYLPQSEIKIARYQGFTRSEIIDRLDLKGPLYQMIDEVEVFFKRNTRLAHKIVDFKRIDIPEYPYSAIREALINAIAHRDYRRAAPIMFSIFDDRIEIQSPGGLVPGLTIDEIEGQHEPRNDKICEIFNHTKDMEELGTGISRMKNEMHDHGLSEPEFLEVGNSFIVKFYGPGNRILDLISSIPEDRQTDLRELGLKDRQIQALSMMVNEGKVFTRAIYEETLKVPSRTASRDLKLLTDKGLIQKVRKGNTYIYKAFST